jgi:hypothetical protein
MMLIYLQKVKGVLKVSDETAGFKSISQRHGSADGTKMSRTCTLQKSNANADPELKHPFPSIQRRHGI